MQHADPVPHLLLPGAGLPLHFSHANGFPPLVYQSLLEELQKEHQLIASLHRPLWADSLATMPDWQVLADDIISLLEVQPGPVISVGHSMGASALIMAAVRRPELFAGLVLVEPVLLRPVYTRLLNGLRPLAQQLVPMIRNTRKRTDRWSDKEAAFRHFRGKSVFAGLDDKDLRHYVEHGTRPAADGGRILRYDKHWEAHCYGRIFDLWSVLEQLSVPVLALRGGSSNTLPAQQWRRWQRVADHDFVEIPGRGHLLPLEEPAELAELTLSWLRRLPR